MKGKDIVIPMEETQSNSIDIEGQHVGSSSEPQRVSFSAAECSKIANIGELAEAEERRNKEGGSEEEAVKTGKQKIQKVPMVLRGNKNFKKIYEPRAISIGPIHHENKKLQLDEQYKSRLAATFINESGKTTEAVYGTIKAEMEELKLLFDPEVIKGYKDEELSWMLFLDGCSTLQLMYGVVKEKMGEYNIKSDQVAFVQQDLFLLENQIPYKVLNLLIDSSQAKDELKKSIMVFLQMNVMAPVEFIASRIHHLSNSTNLNIDEDSIHLLQLLQKFAVFPPTKKEKLSKKLAEYLPNGLKRGNRTGQQSFRNVQELKAAWINLKPSENCSLIDIDFTSLFFKGCLELPPLVVDDSTGPKLLNMIAYEMCPDNFRTNYEVSSYVCLLDSLIDHTNDVKDLRSAKVVYNLLGSDEEVAQLFNEIATDLVRCPSIFNNVIAKIQRHYDNRGMAWMAEFCNTHFSSPWTILSFVGALIALALTFVQTLYAINPPSKNGGN